jgi:branched-chain amino acid transport system permease protein
MFALTRTPLGRMLNAVRDNPERVEFIGYSTRGALPGLHDLGLLRGHGRRAGGAELRDRHGRSGGRGRSGAYLLFVFLGGATFFFGPIMGAVLMVVALVLLSELTKAWLLYLGLIFLFMVMFAPGGLASLIMMNLRVAAFGKLRPLLDGLPGLAGHGLAMLVGAAAMIEMVYHLQLNSALGPKLKFMGAMLHTAKGRGQLVRRGFVLLGVRACSS